MEILARYEYADDGRTVESVFDADDLAFRKGIGAVAYTDVTTGAFVKGSATRDGIGRRYRLWAGEDGIVRRVYSDRSTTIETDES